MDFFSPLKNPKQLRGNPDPHLFRLMPEEQCLSLRQDQAAQPVETFGVLSCSMCLGTIVLAISVAKVQDLLFQGSTL